ncbi:MAG: chromosome segregation protein SMC [Kiritimatiellae bacterium]|nr:chromosome segregation protein SMC [Kiritimatiellia bacterium]
MYLKSIDVIGFKSFADKTHMEFENGMTAIVGPNGCGKSNISDAIRWVLGEQRAGALRGKNMVDCIFTGTDSRKPLGMAEVSITFADCEGLLDIEYNEVTVSRRIFRSGESQYYINKTQSRLKDIQRLFMGTGIGTSSYSFMEQGKIDQILSSRAEDRRLVFEEASGITKYKSDKKEAMRKLAQTDANLLRLTDVIGEVRRQIGSLQRQAGKARKYKQIRDELKVMDIYVSKIRIKELNDKLEGYEQQKSMLLKTVKAGEQELSGLEEQLAVLREELAVKNNAINAVLEDCVQARSDYEHTCEIISINEQRVAEYKLMMARDVEEIDSQKLQLQTKQALIMAMKDEIEKSAEAKKVAEEALNVVNAKFYQHKEQIDGTRSQIHKLRQEVVELENMITRTQNQLVEIDSREREMIIKRERLLADHKQLERNKEQFAQRIEILTKEVVSLEQESLVAKNSLSDIDANMDEKREEISLLTGEISALNSSLAGKQAKLDVLVESEKNNEGVSNGVKDILDAKNPLGINTDDVFGTIASHMKIEPKYVRATEIAINNWIDAVVVKDFSAGKNVLNALLSSKSGSAKLLVNDSSETKKIDYSGELLLSHIKVEERFKGLLNRILNNVYVVDSVSDLPDQFVAGVKIVTNDGILVSDKGLEFIVPNEDKSGNPLLRKSIIEQLENEKTDIKLTIADKQATLDALKQELLVLSGRVAECKDNLQEVRRDHAIKLGAKQSQENEYKEVSRKLELVIAELEEVTEETTSDDEKRELSAKKTEFADRKERATQQISELTHELQTCEIRFSEMQTEVTEHRISFAQARQNADHLVVQHNSLLENVKEISKSISTKSEGILSHEANITRRESENEQAKEKTIVLQTSLNTLMEKSEAYKNDRDETNKHLLETDSLLTVKRNQLDTLKAEKSSVDLKQSEINMHREHLIERVTADYSMTLYEVVEMPDPEWDGGEAPEFETIKVEVAELKRKLEAMGPVNLVAIEEHQQLEERYTFLVEQEEDLVNSKNQLEDMIRKINVTTTEMFKKTFDQINLNFEEMYKILFNGGTAKLVMVNDEDILECGIDIIARPPGKRLQNISLLSGGEKTMTAVALMFAIYMIKPSPFCLLDELDAALDDANIGRFVGILSRFVEKSQFVIITHNRQTMAASTALYGVTMPEKGVSSIISMRFNEAEKYSQ